MQSLPSGTVNFLFTDIEGSTKRWEAHPEAMQSAFSRQEAILRHAIHANGGYAYKMTGDAFQAAFTTAPQALQSAIDAQRAFASEKWPAETGEVRVRMALHTGTTEERGDDYVGPALNRAARLLSAGYGGQVLLTLATSELVRDILPAGITLLDLGEHRLKDLIRPEHIFQLAGPGLPSEFPPLKTLDNHPNNLPRQSASLIGREREIEAVCTLLRPPEVTLFTLTGPGGTGKTRLALQVGAELLEEFKDGVWFVELATLRDHRLVTNTIAQTLGVKEVAGQTLIDTLKSYLRDKHMLLLLDNFEQVGEAAPQVDALLKSAGGLKVLATSRLPLKVYGEKEYAVPPLALPDLQHLPPLELITQYEAVWLFIERARDVKPDFEVTNDNAPAVAEICVRLDGLPLAIELAAARTRLFAPGALLSRLSSRLKLLTGGARNLPARHQTLRNTIEWSYDLLDEVEKQLFRRMAIFQGGMTLEALEEVCAPKGTPYEEGLQVEGQPEMEMLEGAESLVSKNLLQQREGSDGEPRLWMLETIQEYAGEKLQQSGEVEALERAHAHYFMRLAEEAAPQLRGMEQERWLQRLGDEHDNLRAAMRWGREQAERGNAEGADTGLRITGAMWRFWLMRGYFAEGREELEGALSSRGASGTIEQAGGGGAARARALNGAGTLAFHQGDYTAARSLYEDSLSIRRELGDKSGIAQSLRNLGVVTEEQGDYAAARPLLEENLAISREVGDRVGIAYSLGSLGIVAQEQGDYAGARPLYDESLAILREVGDKWGMAWSLQGLGSVSHGFGDYDAARSLLEESLSIRRELGDKSGIAQSLRALGNVAAEKGDHAAAHSLLEESLAISRELEDRRGVAMSLAGLGGVAAGMGQAQAQMGRPLLAQVQAERGARLLGASEAQLEAINAVLEANGRTVYEQAVASARTQLGEEEFEKAWQEGRAMSVEQAIEYALGDSDTTGSRP